MKVSEQLRAARALIDAPEKYFIGNSDARLPNGSDVTHRNKKAVAYSLAGAWRKTGTSWAMLSALCRVSSTSYCMADFAKLPHDELMALFDRAIADAEGRGE